MNKHILFGQNRISAVQSEPIYLQEILVVIVLHFQQYSLHLTETIEKTKNEENKRFPLMFPVNDTLW